MTFSTAPLSVWFFLVALVLQSAAAQARVPEAQASRLGDTLTGVGAEAAANADGSIPAWQGGLTQAPPCDIPAALRLCDPYAADVPGRVIQAADVDEALESRLSAGQRALLARFPDTYQLPIYPTRRSAAYPAFVYAATRRNALTVELKDEGENFSGAAQGVLFPIPQDGREAIWNHLLRYRGVGLRRSVAQATVSATGEREEIAAVEAFRFAYGRADATLDSMDNVLFQALQIITEPARLAGQGWLLRQTLDQAEDKREVWRYEPGPRRTRRMTTAGYDTPALATEDLLTEDQFDGFNGTLDRYQWKLAGKREMWVPYNAYRLHQSVKLDDMLRAGHLNQEIARYELHRVWVVEARLKPNTNHLFAKRVFYLDEDSWQIVLADLYGRNGELARSQEIHSIQGWRGKPLGLLPAVETSYDFTSGRYSVRAYGMTPPGLQEADLEPSYFKPSSMRRRTRDIASPEVDP